jgi:pimeloyl-ACP methyl ester carboxylesterase
MTRRGCVAIGFLVTPLSLFALIVLLAPSTSWSSRAYTAGIVLATGGLLTATRARRRGVTRAGIVIVAATALARLASGARGNTTTMTTTGARGARALGRLVDEGDAAVWGARLAFAVGQFRDPDVPQVPAALREAYAEMRAKEGDAPSPVVPTYAGLETPDDADVLVVDTVADPKGALVFLHGFGGSFALPCWQLAETAAGAHLVTYCPSVGPRGDWWSADGERTVRGTVRMIQSRGIDRIYLAGLSNGARGAALLAPRMRGTFRGIVLISGADADAASAGAPVLLLQGGHDAMFPASHALAYAASHAETTYVDLDAGHFALLLRRQEAARALASWLERNR